MIREGRDRKASGHEAVGRSDGLGPSGTGRERGGELEPNCFVCGPIPFGGSNSVKTIKASVLTQETAESRYLPSTKGSVGKIGR